MCREGGEDDGESGRACQGYMGRCLQGLLRGGEYLEAAASLAELNGDVVLGHSVLWILDPVSPPQLLPILPQVCFAFTSRCTTQWRGQGPWRGRAGRC